MLTVAQTVTKTSAEEALAEPCERRHCEHTVIDAARVEVSAYGETKLWCPDCVEAEFGISVADTEAREESPLRYITPATVAAFVLGLSVMLVVASVLTV